MDKKLYVATDLDGGDLLGAVWAASESEAYEYFNNDEPMIPKQNDRLYVELAETSGYSVEDIKEEFPEAFEESLSESVDTELNIYEMIAARALHFMRINCDMEYVDIANELGIDVQEVLNLIGPDSYDDADIVLEAADKTMEDASISEPLRDKLIGLFWKGIKGYTSDIWFDSSTNEKEEIVWEALKQIDEHVDEDIALDLFWEWAYGLEEDSFIDFDLDESRENAGLKESYRRTVSRGKSLNENELFVDFD